MIGSRRWIYAAPLAFAAACGTAIAQPIVVRSSGPSAAQYPPGRVLDKTVSILLKPLDQLTLLDERGTRVLRGPGSFAIDQSAPGLGLGNRLNAIWTSGAARPRIGAVRGLEPPRTRSPSIWLLDTNASGAFCVADPATLALWRTGTTAATLTIRDAKGIVTTLAWPAGTATLAWPTTLPLTSGADYAIGLDGVEHMIRIVTPVAAPASLEEAAATLARAGCDSQVDTLASSVAIASMAESMAQP